MIKNERECQSINTHALLEAPSISGNDFLEQITPHPIQPAILKSPDQPFFKKIERGFRYPFRLSEAKGPPHPCMVERPLYILKMDQEGLSPFSVHFFRRFSRISPAAMCLSRALPSTAASGRASSGRASSWSGVWRPKPSASGTSNTERARRMVSATLCSRSAFPPVVPRTDTT